MDGSESFCARLRQLAPLVAAGVADRTEETELRSHAAECGVCRLHLTALTRLARSLEVDAADLTGAAAPELAPAMARRLLRRLAPRPTAARRALGETRRGLDPALSLVSLTGVAVVAGLGLLGLLGARAWSGGPPSPAGLVLAGTLGLAALVAPLTLVVGRELEEEQEE